VQYQEKPKTRWLDTNIIICDEGCDIKFGKTKFKRWIDSERKHLDALTYANELLYKEK